MWYTKLSAKTRGALTPKEMRFLAALWAFFLGLALLTFIFNRRVYMSRELLWNVWLSALPLPFCLPVVWRAARGKGGLISWLFGAAWLLMLPNAPYMVTDLIHLNYYEYDPGFHLDPNHISWFGLAHIAGTVVLGCAFGFFSMYLLHRTLRKNGRTARGWLFILGTSALCGIGMYMGRFMRFNSWDIWDRPLDILQQIIDRLSVSTAAFAALFAAITFGGYLVFYLCFDEKVTTDATGR